MKELEKTTEHLVLSYAYDNYEIDFPYGYQDIPERILSEICSKFNIRILRPYSCNSEENSVPF